MKPVTLQAALDIYAQSVRGGYALNTWRNHQSTLKAMRLWLERELDASARQIYLSTISEDDSYMVRYCNTLRPPKRKSGSFNIIRGQLRLFWRFCLSEGWINLDPMRHIKTAKPEAREDRLRLSAQEMLDLLPGAEPRDRIFLAVLMNTALRAGSITLLKVGDINLTNDTIAAWNEKMRRAVDIPITSELRSELILWFKSYAETMGLDDWTRLPNDWTLVPPSRGWSREPGKGAASGKITTYKTHARHSAPHHIVQKALAAHGHDVHWEGGHTLRRSMLREVYELACADGVADPIEVARALADHASPDVTWVYIGVDPRQRKRDDLMRGKSVLSRAAEVNAARHRNDNEDRPISLRGERSA